MACIISYLPTVVGATVVLLDCSAARSKMQGPHPSSHLAFRSVGPCAGKKGFWRENDARASLPA